jgi:hypothetical protein
MSIDAGLHQMPRPVKQERKGDPYVAARLKAARITLEGDDRGAKKRFSDRAGIPDNQYGQFENCIKPLPLDPALKLRNAWGLSLDWLYCGDWSGLAPDLRKSIPATPIAE